VGVLESIRAIGPSALSFYLSGSIAYLLTCATYLIDKHVSGFLFAWIEIVSEQHRGEGLRMPSSLRDATLLCGQ
jgi:hypothetical protein